MKTEYFESVEMSDVGRKRKNNEDACLRIPDKGIFCVADGMGGQAGGDLASEAITTAVQEVFAKAASEEDGTFSGRIALFRKAANQASKWIKNFAEEKVIGQMGSTVVALIIDPRNPARAVCLHAGDSRLYRYRNGQLKQLSSDHSVIEALAAKLGIDPASVPAKYQNELTKAVGLRELVELDKTPVDVLSGDLFLICSDGLTKMLPDETISKFLKNGAQDPVATIAKTLINAANEAGGKDNVTVVLVKAGDISGAPNVIDADEEEESKTMVAPATPSDDDMPTPTNRPDEGSQIPETSDTYQGNTPHTDDPTRDNTPIPTPQPKGLPDVLADKKETNKNKKGKNKKITPFGIMILAGVVAAVGVGGLLNAKKTKQHQQHAATETTNPPHTVAPPTTIPPPVVNPAYHEAMGNAQRAFDNQDYTNAAALAVTALQIKPDDLAATELWKKAEKLIGDYNQAVALAQQAYQLGHYSDAITEADKALAIRKDDFMQRLVADAQSQIQKQTLEDYHAAMKNAQSAFDNHDYKNAEAWAVEALQKMPVDSAATELRDNARQQAAMQDGQVAMKNNNYALASAKAMEALALKPNDPAAAQLASQAQEHLDLQNARKFFDQGDYDDVAKLCTAYPGVDDFTHLAKSNYVEKAVLSDKSDYFNKGDYSFTAQLKRQPYGRKPPFVELIKQAMNEWNIYTNLDTHERAGNWQPVLEKLDDPAFAGLTNKPPFHALMVQAASQRDLAQLNVTFETMLVWFNIKSPTDSYIQTPEARQAKKIDGGIDEAQRDKYLKMVDQLEAGYKNGGWLNQNSHVKYIKALRDAITRHK
jgi:protein phosphatase